MTPNDLVVAPSGLRFKGRRFPCSVGRYGITRRKKEGDGATPAGVHRIVGCLYRPDRMARPVDWAVPIRPGDLWSDDSRQEDYNTMVREPYPGSHEDLRRSDRLYDLVLISDWNWPYAVAGRGSAIFIHRWRRAGHKTEGCVALAAPDLIWLTRRITLRTRLIIQP
ncbi:MAG: L,D-transpeptidase family protein [Pseudomonadota bacterium]